MIKNIPHTIPAALEITGLSEEEAYFILRFAGKLGYDKAIKRLDGNILYRFRRWLIWVGGWEKSKLQQWDAGKPAWKSRYEGKWKDPTPLSLFGHRITFMGRWLEFKVFASDFVIHWPDHLGGWGIYLSPNGTPHHPNAIHFIDQRGNRE
jgi:hypothetical protein